MSDYELQELSERIRWQPAAVGQKRTIKCVDATRGGS